MILTYNVTYPYDMCSMLFVPLQKSKYAVRDRMIEFALHRKEEGPYWERLLKDKTKQHWLKVDFAKWKDEDESDDENGGGGGGDLEEVRRAVNNRPISTLEPYGVFYSG